MSNPDPNVMRDLREKEGYLKAAIAAETSGRNVKYTPPSMRETLENHRNQLLEEVSDITARLRFLDRHPRFEEEYNEYTRIPGIRPF